MPPPPRKNRTVAADRSTRSKNTTLFAEQSDSAEEDQENTERVVAGPSNSSRRGPPSRSATQGQPAKKGKKSGQSRSQPLPHGIRRPGRNHRRRETSSDEGSDDEEDIVPRNRPTATPTVSSHEMVTRVIKDLILSNNTKALVTRQNIIKNQLDGNSAIFNKIFDRAVKALEKDFGLEVYSLDKESELGYTREFDEKTASNFIIKSKYPALHLNEINPALNLKIEQTEHLLLSAILSTIFMKFYDIGAREELLWDSFMSEVGLNLQKRLKVKQQDFRKYLKKEFLDPCYLVMIQEKGENTENADEIIYRYKWGPRSHLEFSKSEMLLYNAGLMEAPFASFQNQIKILSEEMSQEEFERFLAENMNENPRKFASIFLNRREDEGEELINL